MHKLEKDQIRMKVDLQIKDKLIDCLNVELFKSKNVIK
jgi:hypothetical protein